MQDNIQAGLLTEISCQMDFTRFGITLFAPITSDSRSDFIAEINGVFIRIQCKSALESADGNSFSFCTISTNWNTKTIRNYENQIDYFYTSFHNQGYLIPIKEAIGRTKTLRIKAIDKNNSRICWAKDYEIEKVLKKIEPSLSIFIPHKAKPKNKHQCVDCGVEISSAAIRCKKCNALFIAKKKEVIITRGELKELIRTKPFTEIGKMYEVSDNAVRKWCIKFNLPRSKREIKKYSDEEWKNI